MVDIKAVKSLNRSITLKEIKDRKDLQEMKLVKQSRLSVSPVSKNEWKIILKMANTNI